MDAYNVKLVDDDGKLLVDDPKVKEGLIGALRDYTDTYIKGCTPPSSTTWKDPDNNVAFHNKSIIMTHNFDDFDRGEVVRGFAEPDVDAGGSARPARRPMKRRSSRHRSR